MFLLQVYKRFPIKLSFTFALLILDSISFLFFPLVIGMAITGVMEQDYQGIYWLIALSILNLILGSFRRFYDSRIYAKIFIYYAGLLKRKDTRKETSKTVARVGLLQESLSFMEESLPLLMGHLIGLGGTLVIVLSMDVRIFSLCLIVLLATLIIYTLTSKRTMKLNRGFNNELERQVERLDSPHPAFARNHFKRLMKWNIRLSDLETINFSGVWLLMSGLMVLSIVLISSDTNLKIGAILSLVMYVFQFVESAMNLPLYYQQSIRLKEISKRLNSIFSTQS